MKEGNSMLTRYFSFGLALLLSCIGAVGCSSSVKEEAPVVPTTKTSTTPTNGKLRDLGSWKGHWDGKKLTFIPTDRLAKMAELSGIRPQGFQRIPEDKMEFTTDESIVLNSSCPQNEDIPNGYYVSGTPQLQSGTYCPDHHLCASVWLQNDSQQNLTNTYVQVTDIDTGFYGVNPVPVTIPTGYPLDDTLGLWSYGNLAAGPDGDSAWNEWFFYLPNCDDFNFTVKIMALVEKSNYIIGADRMASSGFIDACSLTGHTSILQNASADDYVDNIPAPFPFNLYEISFDGSVPLTIGANGTASVAAIPSDNVSMPDTTNYVAVFGFFPFWDQLTLGSDGVCYGVTGTAPNRRFVLTWKDADLANTTSVVEDLTFSLVIHETTDAVEYLYSRWSDTTVSCMATEGPNLSLIHI